MPRKNPISSEAFLTAQTLSKARATLRLSMDEFAELIGLGAGRVASYEYLRAAWPTAVTALAVVRILQYAASQRSQLLQLHAQLVADFKNNLPASIVNRKS